MSIPGTAFAGRHKRRLLSAVMLPFLCAAGTAAWAQTGCDDALPQAQKSYDLGLFEDVPGQLAPCLAAPTSRATAVQVHALLARAYLAADDLKKAREEVSTILRIDSTFEPSPPPRFAALVAQVLREEQTAQVTSVSKTAESLREAPATVVVVTGEQIRRRGYTDLEQLLHDLPGFDFSRSNGLVYSEVYQRGYNSFLNERSLLLVDGVEQNNLSSGGMYLSRQFAMSNIDRVEVIYGPASTMYGANAYTGVISVLTKAPRDLVAEGKRLGIVADLAAGQLGTRYGDLTVAGRDRSGNLEWSVASRFFVSNETDQSHQQGLDFSFASFDYRTSMRLTGFGAEQFFAAGLCATPSPYYVCSGKLPFQRSVDLTAAGETLVRGLDRSFVAANGLGFHDSNRNFSLNAKARISNLTMGFQMWRSQEGLGSQNAAAFASGRTSWTPDETSVYFKYSAPLGRDLAFNAFARYLQTGLDRADSKYEYFHTYASGFLSLWSLVPPCVTPFLDEKPVGCAPAKPWLESVTFADLSSQLRSELSVTYDPSRKLSGFAGIELVKSSIQSQSDQTSTGPGQTFAGNFEAPEQIEHTDLAGYAQASYKPREALKLVLAGRVSHNEINNKPGASGFGTLFTPRLGAIYTLPSGKVVVKAIYSEAFKDPTDQEKFSIIPFVNNVRSSGLKPEQVKNQEISVIWEPSKRLAVEAAAYQADYTDVVAIVPIAFEEVLRRHLDNNCEFALFGCLQYQNVNEFRIRGVQMTARYDFSQIQLWSNYTYTHPLQTRPHELRVAAIASHRINLGVDAEWAGRWSGSLRTEYVGARRVGAGTTFPSLPFNQLDSYTTADLALNYRILAPGLAVQLAVRNLFGAKYYDSSGVDATTAFPPRVLQAGRTVYLALRIDTGGSSAPRSGPGAR
jgi:outer membrane receptor for ferrienterochelin and colicins